MKLPKTSTLVAAAALTLGLAAGGVGVAYAASHADGTGPMDTLVTALSDRFNLNKAEVQQVFDQHHGQMHVQFEQRAQEKLAQAVTAGKLTQQQADALTAKHAEVKAQYIQMKESAENQTPQQAKEWREKMRTDLEQWAKDNNIPTQYLRFFKHHGGFEKYHGMMMGGEKVSQ